MPVTAKKTLEKLEYHEDIEPTILGAAEIALVDQGIGRYEFWGAKGVHKDMQWEVKAGEIEIDVSDCSYEDADSAIPVALKFVGNISHEDGDADVDIEAHLDSVRWERHRCIAKYTWDGC